MTQQQFVQAVALADLQQSGCRVVQLAGHTIALFATPAGIYAVDNRCPHMGFPLEKGSIKDGILVCHWHHARFDLETGGTFDQFADDVRSFPVEVRDDVVWVDVARYHDPAAHQKERLQVGLERDIPLVVGKAVLVLMEHGDAVEPFRVGLKFGSQNRRNGWGQGLTMHTCFMNMMPHLSPEDRPRALYHGLNAVARDSFGHPPRFGIRPLPGEASNMTILKRWLRQFLAVRDEEGAERCVVSAIRAGATQRQLADLLFTAVTDYRYIDVGHPADFTNKAFEALDIAGWQLAEPVLTSLVRGYARAARMEESNSWRSPIDLIDILAEAFSQFESLEANVLEAGKGSIMGEMVETLLADDPQAIVNGLLGQLNQGVSVHDLAQTVTYAAALRIGRFHTSNEFGDWDTALHTFTFANAIQMGLRRAPSVALLRGVFDAAMSIYLDRFLNIPAARLPEQVVRTENGRSSMDYLTDFPTLLNQQQQVNEAGQLVANVLAENGRSVDLMAMLGKLLLREDRDFHTIQCVEAAINQVQLLGEGAHGRHVLIAAARYLAAHSPTVRAQGQTYQIAHRLHRGDALFAE